MITLDDMRVNSSVSILMPIFNEARYINDCINSILNQSFPHWELIVVDDFSTDESREILESYTKKDPRISCFSNSEKGIIPALKKSFSLSKGEFITRMDGDDLMPNQKLETLIKLLKSAGNHSVATGKVVYFSDSDLGNGFLTYQNWLNGLCDTQSHWEHIYKECVIPSACWMARKSDLLKIEAFQKAEYPEDYDLVFKLYQHGFNVVASDKILHYWRDHSNRASRNDPNYADQKFYDLKLKYFTQIDYNPSLPLFLWGAGKKGKSLAHKLIANNINFTWITNNNKKVGQFIYGEEIHQLNTLKQAEEKQIIIAISDKQFQQRKADLYREFHLKKNQIFNFI